MTRRSTVATLAAPKRSGGNHRTTPSASRPLVRIATVSHTLDLRLAERLREFAFRQRVSESAVIEHALRSFFEGGSDAELGSQLRKAGASLRRRG
ncbi:MAG: hypothetical protein JO349_01415 [Candidatus Eremiobacteraeota bacterium]|nr:hypothetical protein [Candidatus Eremiobacteraeota bacterium]